ncbi:MAG TPA: hypothetical protein VGN35_05970 [Jatrophihabitantaceae bacterium]|jgi:hypothetical protein|nr:hypothetical protein [Jatrophihabitantaceae bacterium]
MTNADQSPITPDEIAAEGGSALPAKEVMSLLDLNANLDLALDAAAPIDLAVGANANIAAPINASVGANVLSAGSTDGAEALQGAEIHQGVTGDASATAGQHSGLDQSGAGSAATPTQPATTSVTPGDTSNPSSALDGPLLNVNVDLNGDLKLAAPIDGAVAANANVAAPIDAAVSANVGSIDSSATAISHQDALITQDIHGDATANGNQNSTINQ